MEAFLVVVEGAKRARIRLKLPTVVGRSEEAKLKVPQSQVSRRHCELYEEDGLIAVDDLGSSNGTRVNGERINEPTFVYPGDTLRVGSILFRAEYETTADVPPAEATSESLTDIPGDILPESKVESKVESTEAPKQLVTEEEETVPMPKISTSDSVVEYREEAQGSFLGIAEINTGDEPAAGPVSDVSIDIGELSQDDGVGGGDSALNDFFKNMDD